MIFSLVDIVIDLATNGATGSFSPAILKIARVFRILRMGRLLRLLKVGNNVVRKRNFYPFWDFPIEKKPCNIT